MSNQTARLAREWAKFTLTVPDGSPGSRAAAEHIMATTTEPTMADVEWDCDKHMLAGATLAVDGATFEATMLTFEDGFISYVTQSGERGMAFPERLTPNGKKYELREVTGDEHPETLTTVEDYENAPTGTVVTRKECEPWTKRDSDDWRVTGGPTSRMDYHMADSKRSVLRWGWGE